MADASRPVQSVRKSVMVALVIAVLIAGCGSGGAPEAVPTSANVGSAAVTATTVATTDAPSGETAGDDACDIVSDEVVAEVLGVEITRREPHDEAGGTFGCLKGADRTDNPEDFFYVSANVFADGASLVDEAGSEAGSVPVAGLGDRAFYSPSVGALFIADGADAIQVQVVQGGVPGSQEDCVTVANDVLDRLG
ncbi:MAG: hypothetical protein ACR2ME_05295 [Acidimicrobiia bacterium]